MDISMLAKKCDLPSSVVNKAQEYFRLLAIRSSSSSSNSASASSSGCQGDFALSKIDLDISMGLFIDLFFNAEIKLILIAIIKIITVQRL